MWFDDVLDIATVIILLLAAVFGVVSIWFALVGLF